MRLLIIGLIFFSVYNLRAQIKNTAYQALLETIYDKSVPLISVDSLQQTKDHVIILDTRSKQEYKVSHIKNARWVGYKKFKKKRVEDLSKDTPIVVHCSIGYRSEKIGEKLQKMGYQKVQNLYGGIFEWINQGYPVYKKDTTSTEDIHPYSKSWGIWLNRGNKTYK